MSPEIKAILPAGLMPGAPATSGEAPASKSLPAFGEMLQKELARGQTLKISAHAEKRLRDRNIVLAREDLAKIDQAVRQAEAKGGRESLIIYGDLALITSVRNRTIVTALDGNSSETHVFTNIDSAVIVSKK